MQEILKIRVASVFCRLKTCLAVILPASLATAQEYSALWGESGELWNTNGLLRDFTGGGYVNGDVPIANGPVGVNVTHFGAVADDEIDDSQAFLDAIAAGPAHGLTKGTP